MIKTQSCFRRLVNPSEKQHQLVYLQFELLTGDLGEVRAGKLVDCKSAEKDATEKNRSRESRKKIGVNFKKVAETFNRDLRRPRRKIY